MKIQAVFQLYKHGDKYVFGKKGQHKMLWRSSEDLKKFKELTGESDFNKDFDNFILVMGSSTFKSFDKKLSGRQHYVFSSKNKESIKTSNGDVPDTVISSIQDFKELQLGFSDNTLVSVIGGFDLIKNAVNNQVTLDSFNINDYEIQDLWITVFNGDFNKTGDLIEVSQEDLQVLLKDYQLISIENLETSPEKIVDLTRYSKKEIE